MANPPARVGREPKPAAIIVTLDRLQQAEVALLDQVCERHATVIEASRDRHHEPQVRLDEVVTRVGSRTARGMDAAQPLAHDRATTERWQIAATHPDAERQAI